MKQHSSLSFWRLLLVSVWIATGARPGAVEFPGPMPGAAQGSLINGAFTLENNTLSDSWVLGNGQWRPGGFRNKLSGDAWSQASSELFRLTLSSGPTIAASEFDIADGPMLRPSQPNPQSSRAGDRLPGVEVVARLRHEATGIEVDWRAVLRDGANYLRQLMDVHSTNESLRVTTVELLDCATTNLPGLVGSVDGSPAVAGLTFFGAETPIAKAVLTSDRVRYRVSCDLPLGAGVAYDFSGVVGVFPQGQMRRGFLHYLERERARPCRPMLQWNSWFAYLWNTSEAKISYAIDQMDLELRQRRGVAIESYVIDDGWDDPLAGFWAVNTNKYPQGFAPLRDRVRALDSHLGVWISPQGGYDYIDPAGFNWREERIKRAIEEGVVTNSVLDLSIPTYFSWWTNKGRAFIQEDEVNYFKWDRASGPTVAHFLSLLRAANILRAVSTNLFINTTVGTWPSPFWLNHVDSIWRGGNDWGFYGPGDARERWLTYRDLDTYSNVSRRAPLFPLNSLMLCGILVADLGGGALLDTTGSNFVHEVRSFFGSGTQMQELYVTPAAVCSNAWNHLAEAAGWAQANADVLVDTHWIGGNPQSLEVYGWAAWTPRKGCLVLRNPSDATNGITLDVATVFELPDGAPTFYDLSAAYPDQRLPVEAMQGGVPRRFELAPFEVLVFDAWPRTTFSNRLVSLGPASYWRLGESGATAFDVVGANHGSYTNTANHAMPGALLDDDDGAVQFGRLDSRVLIPDAAASACAGTNAFSVVTWVKFDSLDGVQRLFSNQGAGPAGCSLAVVGGQTLRFTAFGVADADAPVDPLATNRWYGVAVVRRGLEVQFYLDGRAVGTNALAEIVPSAAPLALGGNPSVAPDGETLRGALDETAIFNRALSPVEVQLIDLAHAGRLMPPQILQQPSSTLGYIGGSARLRVAAAGGPPLSYQWKFEGSPIPGATDALLVLTNLDYANASQSYSVTVANPVGSVDSEPATLVVLPTVTYATAVLEDQPTAYWRLGESNEPTAFDALGVHHGSAAASVDFGVCGALPNDGNTAATFDGSTGCRIEVPFAPELNPPSFSVELWARVTGGAGTYRSPFTSRDDYPQRGYCLYAGSNDRWQFFVGAGTNPWRILVGPAVLMGQWVHLVGTYDGTNMALFADGQLAATAPAPLALNTGRPLRIGAGATEGSGAFFFVGDVDEVAVYDHVLTAAQIQRHHELAFVPVRLTIERTGGALRLAWPNGMLEEANYPGGPWTPVANAVSPWPIPAGASAGYYRVKVK